MAKEYILREAALEVIYTSTAPALEVKAMPAADVIPVVRCRECECWERYNNTAGCGYCHDIQFEYGANGYVFHPVREPDFFCANGKRKDGGQDE